MQGIVIQVMELLTNQTGGSTTTQKLTKAGSHSLCWRNKKKEAVLSETREWCHPKEVGILAALWAGAGVAKLT